MTGFTKYLRFIIRRERVISLMWIVFTVLFTYFIAVLYPSLLGDEISKTAMIEILKSPAMVGMMGPVYGVETYTTSIAFSQMMTIWVMIAIGTMNIFFVNRHTRADEEQGRLEMLRSFSTGRLANSAAAVLGAVLLNMIIAAGTAAVIIIVNAEGCTPAGAAVYSHAIGSFGIVMAAVTLLCAQLFSTSRGVGGAAFAVLGLFYLMRAAGDYNDSIVSYISPMGLGLRVFAFHENNVYPILIHFLQAAVIIAISFAVCSRRDLGEGVIPARRGRKYAKKSLLSPFGLAWRLSKNTAIVWCFVVFIVGAMYGSMLGDIDSFIESNDFYKQMMQVDSNAAVTLTDSFIATLFLITAHIAVIPVITVAGKLRSEESRGRLEQVFARSVCRVKLLGAFVIIASVLSVLVLFFSVLGLYAAGYSTGAAELGTLMKAGMCYLPAMWMFAGIAILLIGILPRLGSLVWLVYAYSFGVVYLGRMLNMPKILERFSPFGNIPQVPVQELSAAPLVVLTLLAAGFTAIGIYRFSSRDIG